ncbi:MAG: hypothetical protein Fur006_61300 [Coleofasciculaceae cyanobacterium]
MVSGQQFALGTVLLGKAQVYRNLLDKGLAFGKLYSLIRDLSYIEPHKINVGQSMYLLSPFPPCPLLWLNLRGN